MWADPHTLQAAHPCLILYSKETRILVSHTHPRPSWPMAPAATPDTVWDIHVAKPASYRKPSLIASALLSTV